MLGTTACWLAVAPLTKRRGWERLWDWTCVCVLERGWTSVWAQPPAPCWPGWSQKSDMRGVAAKRTAVRTPNLGLLTCTAPTSGLFILHFSWLLTNCWFVLPHELRRIPAFWPHCASTASARLAVCIGLSVPPPRTRTRHSSDASPYLHATTPSRLLLLFPPSSHFTTHKRQRLPAALAPSAFLSAFDSAAVLLTGSATFDSNL